MHGDMFNGVWIGLLVWLAIFGLIAAALGAAALWAFQKFFG